MLVLAQKKIVGEKLLGEQNKIEATFRKLAADDFMCFALGIQIDSDYGPKMFQTCIAPYLLQKMPYL